MTSLKFTKMQGLGNDFVVLDGIRQRVELSAAQIRLLADRRFGVGCDQVLLVERATGDADFRYRIFNADGGEVEQCGNGARCFVIFVRAQGLTSERELRVETAGGLIYPRLEDDGQVTVDMGVPRFAPEDVPFTGGKGAVDETLEVDGVAGPPVRAVDGQSACGAAGCRCGCRAGRDAGSPGSRTMRASRGAPMPATCRSSIALPFVCACGNAARANPRMRHRCVRGRSDRHQARPARFAGARTDARRGIGDRVGWRWPTGAHDRAGSRGVRWGVDRVTVRDRE
jgi:hypothetical protein